VCACVRACVREYIHTYIHTYVCMYIHAYRCYMEMGEGCGMTKVSPLWHSQTGALASITNTPTPMPPFLGNLFLVF
jgi:hypothetical protein